MHSLIQVIIEHQYSIIGPLAIEQANKVPGLKVSYTGNVNVQIENDDNIETINNLVNKYKELFGQTSVEVCKDAVKEVSSQVSSNELPDILK